MIQNFADFTPQIDADAFVHAQATIIGNVIVGARSSIWPSVVLRGDMGSIEIGDDTSIQDGTVCHITLGFSKTIVGNRVTVGHRVILHGCRVEDQCLIGMGAILLDNCVIGQGSLIGAGALVTVGTVIPPHSLVMGMPGKVIRRVNDKERAMIDDGWPIYVEYAARYRREQT